MQIVRLLALVSLLAAAAASASAPIPAEKAGKAVLPELQPSWFLALDYGGAAYVFDGADGEVKGTISHSQYTTAIVTLPSRKEAYLVDSYYSRLVRGTRTDVLTVVDMSDLTTKAEIQLPAKTATLLIRGHIGLLNDERHVVVFNMTPAQSVSIVDVVERKFVGEISTAGCAIVMPVELRSFLMLCGDGTLQLIELSADGSEIGRRRSKVFFDVNKDPVFSEVIYTGSGWLLTTHNGSVREVRITDGRIDIGEAWSMLNDEDRQDGNAKEQWRPGGMQPFALHRSSALFYALMHKGKVDTHGQDGKEIWVFDTNRRRRVARFALPFEGRSLLVSQEAVPHIYLCDKDHKLHIYDGYKLKLQRSIDDSGLSGGALLQTLMPYD
jgi:methylamine dehydrogenase heavy chain